MALHRELSQNPSCTLPPHPVSVFTDSVPSAPMLMGCERVHSAPLAFCPQRETEGFPALLPVCFAWSDRVQFPHLDSVRGECGFFSLVKTLYHKHAQYPWLLPYFFHACGWQVQESLWAALPSCGAGSLSRPVVGWAQRSCCLWLRRGRPHRLSPTAVVVAANGPL